MSQSKFLALGSSHCKTEFLKREYVFRWTLKDINYWPCECTEKSVEFDIENGTTFQVELYVVKQDCKFYIVSSDKQNGRVHFEILITDCNEKILFSYSMIHLYTADDYHASYTFSRRDLEEFSASTPNNEIIFKCVMKFGKCHTGPTMSKATSMPNNYIPLVEDLKGVYVNSICTDLNLLVEENVILPVHKVILCARSPVFAKMLTSTMERTQKDCISIEDMNLIILQMFVEFLYTGIVSTVVFEELCDLYRAAVKYQVISLRKTCAELLLTKLKIENACHVLRLASRHSDNQFKDSLMDVFKFNFDAILETDSWKEFVKHEAELASEVILMYRGSKWKCFEKDGIA